ncbi:MAG TPA: class I SAM-dependent methyltransferase [Methanocorpusculum sp.]|nr:class I SAM-dependent methyltransferase [Methanocorpusculum sp.]HJK00854.1 class I SAM-dependent methyltransferase [Methanocorpusculum sp.]
MSLHSSDISLENVDYCLLWDEQHARSVAQKEKMGEHNGSFWSDQGVVNRFVRNVIANDSSQIEKQIAELQIPPGSSVLDIGAGPGTLAVPLSRDGCRVTAIEPLESMRLAMEQYRRIMRAPPIIEICKRWEDVTLEEVGVHDVVIASHSLIMGDIRNCLLKMDAAAHSMVHLYWFLTSPSAYEGNEELWPILHGEPYCSEASANILWNALCQLGIYANILVETKEKSQHYLSFSEMQEDYYKRMSVTEEWQKHIVDAFLLDRTVHEELGYVIPGISRTAHIWWEK